MINSRKTHFRNSTVTFEKKREISRLAFRFSVPRLMQFKTLYRFHEWSRQAAVQGLAKAHSFDCVTGFTWRKTSTNKRSKASDSESFSKTSSSQKRNSSESKETFIIDLSDSESGLEKAQLLVESDVKKPPVKPYYDVPAITFILSGRLDCVDSPR